MNIEETMKRISLFQGLGEDALGKVVACMKKES
jgi:hypothetical protein